jgi:hypothetical protein
MRAGDLTKAFSVNARERQAARIRSWADAPDYSQDPVYQAAMRRAGCVVTISQTSWEATSPLAPWSQQ